MSTINYQTENKIEDQIEANKIQILELYQQIAHLEQKNLELEEEINKKETKKFEFSLNENQRKAVESVNSNSIIIACPGSGKTHTLIAKTVYLIKICEVDPKKIILVTFTKKASTEMQNRLAQKLGDTHIRYVGTLHGLAYRALQKYDDINYTILDEKDRDKAIHEEFVKLTENEFKDEYEVDVLSMLHKYVIVIHEMICALYPKKIKEILEKVKLTEYEKIVRKTLSNYETFKLKHKYLDFNDLMIRFVNFLQDERSNEFKDSYDYILFDEYQDINSIQDLILTLMNEKCQNLTVVGDDAQAIYAFRGSEVRFILNFKENYEGVNVTKLEQNYRSTPEIINFCNAIIKNNNDQLDKKMIPVKNSVHIKPKIMGFKTGFDEMVHVVGRIRRLIKNGVSLKEIAIISRKNRQLDCFEFELIKHKINYIKSKGIGILDRVHVKDFLSFLVVLVNRESIIHWRRILNLVTGIGAVTADKILNSNKNLFTLKLHTVETKSRKLLIDLIKLLKKIEEAFDKNDLDQICSRIIEYLTPIIEKRIKVKEQMTAEEKIDDLNLIKSVLIRVNDLEQFLGDIHLTEEMDVQKTLDTDKKEHLLLTTIHGAKGLEWDYVFLIGASSDIMPCVKSSFYQEEIVDTEEERRLFYVGCSRARKSLEITLSYDYHFVTNNVYTSPFISEIEPKLYLGKNLQFPERLFVGDVTHVISNYLLLCSSSRVYPHLKKIPCEYKSWYVGNNQELIHKMRLELIRGTFLDNLIAKIVFSNYLDEVDKISVPVYDRFNIVPETHYYNFTDPCNRWDECLNSILRVSILKTKLPCSYREVYDLLCGHEQIQTYKKMEQTINEIVDNALAEIPAKKKNNFSLINLHYNLSWGEIKGEADLIVGQTLIEIKASRECIATTQYVLQTLIYVYLLKKKGMLINKIILFNPILGESYKLLLENDDKQINKIFKEIFSAKS